MATSSEHIRILFMEQLTGTLSESDSEELAHLLATDAAAREMWASLQEESVVLDATTFAFELDPVEELARLHAVQETVAAPVARASDNLRHRYRWLIRMAAAVLLLLVATGLYQLLKPARVVAPLAHQYTPAKPQAVQLLIAGQTALALTGDSAIQQLQSGGVQLQNSEHGLAYTGSGNDAMNTLLVPAAADYQLTLSDGTEVWLNAATRLRFPFAFSGRQREVYIEGEAYFKVAKNSDLPFIVHTPHTTIQVLGTAFNINTYSTRETTSLVEGAVIVMGAGNKKVPLKPGTESVYHGESPLTVQGFDEGEVLSWMKGIVYFHHTTLLEMQPLLQRWFDIKIVFDQPAVANTSVTGMVEKNKLPEFLQDLQTSTHLRYYFNGNQLHFSLP